MYFTEPGRAYGFRDLSDIILGANKTFAPCQLDAFATGVLPNTTIPSPYGTELTQDSTTQFKGGTQDVGRPTKFRYTCMAFDVRCLF